MRLSTLAGNSFAVLLTSALLAAGIAGATPNSEPVRLTGPLSHDNLAVYFVHGTSKAGPVPLTLQEALAQGAVQVSETGNVNTLAIENLGDQAVFVQAGDVVKGGRQDRTLTVSLLLPPKSGRIPIASFCVEHGRWSARNAEDPTKFSASAAAVPSREMKLAMQAPMPVAAGYGGANTGVRQQKVWDGVKLAQERLAAATGADVRSPQSASSLQLALENEKLAALRKAYVAALQGGRRRGRRHRRLCVRGQRQAQQRGDLRIERPVPQNVAEAARRQRHRGDQPPQRRQGRGPAAQDGERVPRRAGCREAG